MPRALRTVRLLSAFLLPMLAAGPAATDPYPLGDLPPELVPWVPWVLDDVPEHACPAVAGAAVCSWPGALTLELGADGGRFVQRAAVDRQGYFPLPGDQVHWPQDVRVDGKPATVIEVDGRPVVELLPGAHQIDGGLAWRELPEGIRIPADTAIVDLRLEGRPVPFPRRDEDGLLWLQSATAADEEGERLDLEVYRHIADGVPLTVTTRIVARASGKSREVDLGPVLLADTTTLSVSADIPARIDKDGRLRIQVRAGTHSVEVVARTGGSPDVVAPLARAPRGDGPADPWPGDEIWVWQADEELRQVTISGPPGIDPSRTNLPSEWAELPAFLIQPGTALKLETTRRGEPEPPPDQLHLSRELWMDLDGDGFTVRDRMSGELSRTWRLDLTADGALGHVAVSGEDQLITESPVDKRAGVELRSGDLDLVAEWRLEGGSKRLPAVGWSENVQELGATLNLPPGWTLLSARGVDELPGTWWDEWDLFSFFFVLLVSLAIGKLTRWWFGLIALVTLVLTHQEADAPFIVWISLLIALGLLKVLPEGKLRVAGRIWWWLSVIWLVLVLVPFSVSQVRNGLYPQIAEDEASYGLPGFMLNAELEPPMAAAPAAPPPEEAFDLDGRMAEIEVVDEEEGELGAMAKEEQLERKVKRKKGDEIEQIQQQLAYNLGSGSSSASISGKGGRGDFWRQALQQDPKAVVQTGPGVPNWRWKSWELSWSGPVDKEHEIRLYLISPAVNLLLSFLRVLLVVVLAIRVIREALAVLRNKRPPDPAARAAAGTGQPKVAAVATGLALLLAPLLADAGTSPDPGVLDQLRQRLTRPPACRPDCVSTSKVAITLAADELAIAAEVHVADRTSWPIPGPARNWVPQTVTVDGRPAAALALLDDGFVHLRLEPGRHAVRIVGPVPPGDAVTLEFGGAPHHVTVEAPGWDVAGLRDDGRAESSIQLTRLVVQEGSGAGVPAVDESSYPPWLEITRTLDLGIPWLVHTRVRRVSPAGAPVVARVPLLPGESVTESELQVEDGEIVLSLGRDDTDVGWSSTLEEQPEITLTAPSGKPWSEIWVVNSSPIWRCTFDGQTPIKHKVDGRLQPTFRPWPGEALRLSFARPAGVEGQSVTIDSARLRVSPGIRLVKAELQLMVRASRGGVQQVTLPPRAAIQELSLDGAQQPYRQDGRVTEITLRPGRQRIDISWQQPGGITALHRVPEVGLGGSAANATVVVDLPSDRWLLFTGGPSWGPAVLFWGFLVVVLLAGLILGRIPLSPLKGWQWALLALGLTQIPVWVSLIIVGWFFALAWRQHKPPANFFLHNALQIVIGHWTLAALGCVFAAVYFGLAVQPDMQVAGGGSSNTELIWYVDRLSDTLPCPWVLSLPILVWKIFMLCWSLWLAWSLVKWGPWGWRAFSHELLWRSIPRRELPVRASAAPPAPAPEPPAPEPEPPADPGQ